MSRILLILYIVLLSVESVSDASTLSYSTMVADSITYSSFYAIDIDQEGFLYLAVPEHDQSLPDGHRDYTRIFKINPSGTSISVI